MKLSIITVNLNNIEGLKNTIQSIINQNYTDFEWIVIDGGSTDGSKDLIMSYSDRINYWVSEKDTGIYNAMNKGIAHANGEYLQFLNSGDYFCDSSVLMDVMTELKSDEIVYGDFYYTNGDTTEARQFGEHISFYDTLKYSIGHGGSFIPRQLLLQFPYDETLKITSDWMFFIKVLLQSYPFRHINRFIYYFDCQGISSTNQQLVASEKDMVINKLLPPSILYDYQKTSNDNEIINMIQKHILYRSFINASMVYMRFYERTSMAIKKLLHK